MTTLERIPVLVAGIGNVFLGDDGFGSVVAERLRHRPVPSGVRVIDFGIRAFDLALALERTDAAILVDTVRHGRRPGTLYVLEPEYEDAADAVPDGHALTAHQVLRHLAAGERPRLVWIVGCEPESFGPAGIGRMGLSEPVETAIDEALALVERLLHEVVVARGGDA